MAYKEDSALVRGFAAVSLPGGIKEFLGEATENARALLPGYRFTRHDNLHITLLFLGDVSREDLLSVTAALRESASATNPFTVQLGFAGCFPQSRNPRILHVGIGRGEENLNLLAGFVRAALLPLGYSDNKPFRAHITMARQRKTGLSAAGSFSGTDTASVWQEAFTRAKKGAPVRSLSWQIEEITLMQSILRPGGPLYIPLDTFGLGAGQWRSDCR